MFSFQASVFLNIENFSSIKLEICALPFLFLLYFLLIIIFLIAYFQFILFFIISNHSFDDVVGYIIIIIMIISIFLLYNTARINYVIVRIYAVCICLRL